MRNYQYLDAAFSTMSIIATILVFVNFFSTPKLQAGTLALGGLAVWLGRKAMRYRAASRTIAWQAARPMALLLRSFADDEMRSMKGRQVLLHLYGQGWDEFEIELWSAAEWALKCDQKDCIALRRPWEPVPPEGFVRATAGDDWHQAVEQLAQYAKLIIVLVGPTGGLAWELGYLAAAGLADRGAFVVPRDGAEMRWRTVLDSLAEAAVVLGSARLVIAQAQPHAVASLSHEDQSRLAREAASQNAFALTLRKLGDGYDATFWTAASEETRWGANAFDLKPVFASVLSMSQQSSKANGVAIERPVAGASPPSGG